MSFRIISFFVRLNTECSKTRQESHSKFADHQMHDDIFPRHLLYFFSLQIMSHYCEILFIVKLLCSCHTYQNKRSLFRHFMLQSRTKENNIMLWNVIVEPGGHCLAVPFLYWLQICILGTMQVEEHLVGPHLYENYMPLYAQSGSTNNHLLIVVTSKSGFFYFSLYTSVHAWV